MHMFDNEFQHTFYLFLLNMGEWEHGCSQVSHIWGNYKGQHTQSALDTINLGYTSFVITAAPLPVEVLFETEFHCVALAVSNLQSAGITSVHHPLWLLRY